MDGAAASTQRLTDVTDGVSSLWDGAALASANTFTGSVSNLASALVANAAALASIIVEQEGVVEAVNETTSRLAENTRTLERNGLTFEQFAAAAAQFGQTQDSLAVFARISAKGINDLGGALGVYGPLAETGADRTAKMAKEFGLLNRPTRTLNALFKEFAESLKAVGDGFEGLEIETTKAELEALGVVLDGEVNEAIAKNNNLLLKADELLRLGIITREDFNRTQERVAITNSKLNGTFVENVEVLVEATQGTNVFSTALRENLQALENEAVGLRLVNTEFERGTLLVEQRSRTGGVAGGAFGSQTIFGEQTTQGGTFFIPDEVEGGANGRVVIRRGTGFV